MASMNKTIFSFFFAMIGFATLLNAQVDDVLKKDSLIETKLLKQHKVKKVVKRNGDTLFLKYANGNKDLILNTKELIRVYNNSGDSYILTTQKVNGKIDTIYHTRNYRLINVYNSVTLFLIKKIEIDNGNIDTSYLLKDSKAGAFSDMLSKPIFSPDGNRFITTQSFETGDGRILGVSIINNSENKFEDEFYVSDDKLGYAGVFWVGNNEIKIVRNNIDGKPIETLKYKWNETKWILVE